MNAAAMLGSHGVVALRRESAEEAWLPMTAQLDLVRDLLLQRLRHVHFSSRGSSHDSAKPNICSCTMQISTMSMVVAAIVEVVRLGQVHRMGLYNSTDPVAMSVFWLVPQYFIIGAAEIMVNIGTLEMFYSEVS